LKPFFFSPFNFSSFFFNYSFFSRSRPLFRGANVEFPFFFLYCSLWTVSALFNPSLLFPELHPYHPPPFFFFVTPARVFAPCAAASPFFPRSCFGFVNIPPVVHSPLFFVRCSFPPSYFFCPRTASIFLWRRLCQISFYLRGVFLASSSLLDVPLGYFLSPFRV